MNESSNPNRVRRLAATAAGFVISVISTCAAAPSAFAMVVPPVGGGSMPVHHRGTPGWEIALIVVAVAVVGLFLLATVRHRKAAKRSETGPVAGAASTGSLSRAGG
jgi:hypothetical protein